MKDLKEIIAGVIVITTLIILLFVIFSCSPSSKQKIPDENTSSKDVNYEYVDGLWGTMEYRIQEKTIDSCEYIIIFGVEGRNIIHKANCKNSEHICK